MDNGEKNTRSLAHNINEATTTQEQLEEDSKLKVVDKRGQEPEVNELQRSAEARLVEEAKKPKVIPTVRCPVCKVRQSEANYLFNKQLLFLICPDCGGCFMKTQVVKQLFAKSMQQHMKGGNGGVGTK